MRFKILLGALASGIVLANAATPALAVSSTSNVLVGVIAGDQATIGVTYSNAASNISCNVGTQVVGAVVCTNTATLSGNFRTTLLDTGGASVSITGAAIPGTLANTLAPSLLTMTCTGGTTAGQTYPGTAGTLATGAALALTPVNCQTWTGAVVDAYSLVATLSIDSSKVPADTYTTTAFTATATAN